MVTIFLCDDSPEIIEKYIRLIAQIAEKQDLQISISAFGSGEELIFHLSDSPNSVDIIYLDVLMGSLNGMETAKRLRALGCKAEVIFLTFSEDYVFEAFDVSPLQYLIKNTVSDERFEQVFLHAVSLAADKEAEMFVFESGNTRKMIPIKEIAFFEIWKRIVKAHRQNGDPFEFYATLENLENQLSIKNFVRTHRSYLVNLQYITKFQPHGLLLKTNEVIPIGVTYAEQVKEAFSKYVSQFNIRRL